VTSEEPTEQQRLAERLAQQWARSRAERRSGPPPVEAGTTNLAPAQVPYGVDLAAAWAWRFLVIAAAGYLILWLMAYFAVITVPVAIALLIAALVGPVVRRLHDLGVPQGLGAGLVVLGGIASVGLLLTFVGSQIAAGASDLADSVVQGIEEIRSWLKNGPLNASDTQINDALAAVQDAITDSTAEGGVLNRTLEVGTALGHALAGLFIVLFSTYFFLADGDRIWAWLVRIAPRAARERVDDSGRVAWRSLTQFVRATVLVAAVDALGIMLVAAILGVPFVLAIGVLVFLGAFVPMVGATIAGTVAVLVALVDQGPVTALLMLGGVILVQQIEGHVLQPFLMGRFVSLHPLGVIVAIGCGVLVAGIAGALIAVPLAAVANAVVGHLARYTEPGKDPEVERTEDRTELGEPPPESMDDAAERLDAEAAGPGAVTDATDEDGEPR
jgi:predicted PurR-regulated permease PerM